MEDRQVIDAFVGYLRDNSHPDLRIGSHPDDNNSRSPDIDTIAGDFAIEHTSVDTLPNQRRDSDWLEKAAGGLESEIPWNFPFHLMITLEYNAVAKGQNWLEIREALKTWILNDFGRLSEGRHTLADVSGVPFRFNVTKATKRRPGVFFIRQKVEDNSLPERIQQQFERKAEKLSKYHKSGTITVLLVESNDPALMNERKMLEAIRTAYPAGLPTAVDELWYADSSISSEIKFHNFTSELVSKREA